MAIIKGSTKRGQEMIQRAGRNLGRDLWQVYGRFSRNKVAALDHCKEMCYRSNGKNFRIISASSFQFSVAWEFMYETMDQKTGEIIQEPAIQIETATNSYTVLVDR